MWPRNACCMCRMHVTDFLLRAVATVSTISSVVPDSYHLFG